jgi:Ran GTPase-activating protein (RanGAP) involved in mRNA processing and transport
MSRGTCCLFRAQEALSRLEQLYSHHAGGNGLSPEGLLPDLMEEVGDALSRSYGEKDENENESDEEEEDDDDDDDDEEN